MQTAVPYVSSGRPTWFNRPAGIVDKIICTMSGAEPSNWCKGGQRSEIFAADQPPLPAGQDLRRQVTLDTWTGLEASPACNDFTDQQIVINVSDPWARKWFGSKDGRNWLNSNGFSVPPMDAPGRECNSNDPRPTLQLNVNEGQVINQPTLAIQGTANATGDFKSWRLEFGLGSNPGDWTVLAQSNQPANNALMFNWDLSNLPNQTISLHLYAAGANGYADKYVHFSVAIPTPTPTITPSPTPTDTPLPVTPSDTPAPTATDTPVNTATP
jgi:hypothetical protein